jgi:hypothetical protein
MMDTICSKLGINSAALNSHYVVEPVINDRGGDPAPSGRATAAELRERFGVAEAEDLFDALESRGVLSATEAAWLREV